MPRGKAVMLTRVRWEQVLKMREEKVPWSQVAAEVGICERTLRSLKSRYNRGSLVFVEDQGPRGLDPHTLPRVVNSEGRGRTYAEYSRCPECGAKVQLPCLSCRVENLK